MATTTKRRRRAASSTGRSDASRSRAVANFAPGTLEAELAAIGRSVPAGEWAKVPSDYFANLDHYLYGAPKKK